MGLPTIRFIARTGQAQQGMNRLGNATIRFSQVASSNIARVGAALSAVGALSVRMASDLDEQLRKVQNLTGFSQEQRLLLSDSIDRLSRQHGLDARMLSEGAEAVHTQGVAVGNLAKELDLASKVANAFGGSFEDIARNLTKMANVWDISTENIVAYGQAGARIGDTNLSKLLEGSTVVSPAAKQAGVDYDEMAIFMGFATRELKNTRLAATALRQVFDELARTNSTIATTIQTRYGMTFKELAEHAGNTYDVFAKLEKDFGRAKFIQMLSSVDAKSGLTTILQQLDDIRYEASIPLEVHAEGLEKAFENIAVSFDHKIREMTSSWRSFLRNLTKVQPGDNIYDAVTALTDVLESGDFRKAFEDMADTLVSFLPLFTGATKALAGVATKDIPGINTNSLELLLYATLAQKSFGARERAIGKLGPGGMTDRQVGKTLSSNIKADMKKFEKDVILNERYDKQLDKIYRTNPRMGAAATMMYGQYITPDEGPGFWARPRGSQFAGTPDPTRQFNSMEEYRRTMFNEGLASPEVHEKIYAKTKRSDNKMVDPSKRTVQRRVDEYIRTGDVLPDQRFKANRASAQKNFVTRGMDRASAFMLTTLRPNSQLAKDYAKYGARAGDISAKAMGVKMAKGVGSGIKLGLKTGVRFIPHVAMGWLANDLIKGATGFDVLGTGNDAIRSVLNTFFGKKEDKRFGGDKALSVIDDYEEKLQNNKGVLNELESLGEGERGSALAEALRNVILEYTPEAAALQASEDSKFIEVATDLLSDLQNLDDIPQEAIEKMASLIYDAITETQGDVAKQFLEEVQIREVTQLIAGATMSDSGPYANAGESIMDTMSPSGRNQLMRAINNGDVQQILNTIADPEFGISNDGFKTLKSVRDEIGSFDDILRRRQEEWVIQQNIPEQNLAGYFDTGVKYMDEQGRYMIGGPSLEDMERDPLAVESVAVIQAFLDQLIQLFRTLRSELPDPIPLASLFTSYNTDTIQQLADKVRSTGGILSFHQSQQAIYDTSSHTPEQYDAAGRRAMYSSKYGISDGFSYLSDAIRQSIYAATGPRIEAVAHDIETGKISFAQGEEQLRLIEEEISILAKLLGIEEDKQESRTVFYSGVMYSDYDASVGV